MNNTKNVKLAWETYQQTGYKYSRKARYEDREDVEQDIILTLAEVDHRYQMNGKPSLGEHAINRIASIRISEYWRKIHRQRTITSLNTKQIDDDGNENELLDVLADDNAIDLDMWLDVKTWLLGCPYRMVQIVRKKVNGQRLSSADRNYLWKYRKKSQIPLQIS